MTMDYIKTSKEVEEYLKKVLEKRRFNHTLRVAKMARDLAKNYGLDEDKAFLAGLIHDIGKKREDELLKKYDISSFASKEDQKNYFPVIHSALGYHEAKEVFSIEDEDILNAILYHTTGRPGMSKLEKIVYIADALEPARRGKGIDKMRKLAFKNLDQTLVVLMDRTIGFCIERKRLIHPLTFEARNYYVKKGVDFE